MLLPVLSARIGAHSQARCLELRRAARPRLGAGNVGRPAAFVDTLASTLRGYGPPPYKSVHAHGYVMGQYDKLAGGYSEPKAYETRSTRPASARSASWTASTRSRRR